MENFLKDLAKMLDDPKVSDETKETIRQMLAAEKANNERLWQQLESVMKK